MKTCARCAVEKPLSDFNRRAGRESQPYCRECQKTLQRERYQDDRSDYLERNRKTRERLSELIRQRKSGPCADCGGRFHFSAMDFDHLGIEDKVAGLSQLRHSGSVRKIEAELKKCEVVCANCHRVRTYNRKMAELSRVI